MYTIIPNKNTVYEFYTRKKFDDREVISCKIGQLPPTKVLRKRKPIEQRHVQTARVSSRRSRSIVSDLLASNTFVYFVTLTFGIQARLNDSAVKAEWDKWRNNFRRCFPHAYYVAVPEYHKKGGLHIHMVLGGITAKELMLINTDYVCCHWAKRKYLTKANFERQKSSHELHPTDGVPIYNVGAWELGFSTCTRILFPNAVYNYISKYITKGGIDPRFCDAKRYWCSKKLKRPLISKYRVFNTAWHSIINDHISLYTCAFYSQEKGYYVFENIEENDGIEYPHVVKTT